MLKSCECLCVHSVFVTSFALVSIVSWLRDFCLVVDVMVSGLSHIYCYLLRSRSVFITCRFSLYNNLYFGFVFREPTVIVLYDTPSQLCWQSLCLVEYMACRRAGDDLGTLLRRRVCVRGLCLYPVCVYKRVLPLLVGVYHRPYCLGSIFLVEWL